MRKFLLLLAVLCGTMGAWAQAYQKVPHAKWTVTAPNQYSSVSGNEGGVAFIKDEDPATFYHSDWDGDANGNKGCQGFLVDMAEEISGISKITYTGRSDNKKSGWARGVKIYLYTTLPDGLPADLSTVAHNDKDVLFNNTEILGTPAFDNTTDLWADDLSLKTAEFAEAKTARYVLFVMHSGLDAWLTCSDFNVWQKGSFLTPFTNVDNPEHVYILKSKNNLWMTTYTSPSENKANVGRFAFYAVEGKENAYKMLCVDTKQWISYTKADGYSNGTNFVTLTSEESSAEIWNVTYNDSKSAFQLAPYNNSGVAKKYMNWFGGTDSNPLDNTSLTVGLWQQGATDDNGSAWEIQKVDASAIISLSQLKSDKVYTFKSGRSNGETSHYLLYHSDAPDNLSSTYSANGHSMEYSDATTNFQFALYKGTDGAFYMYNVEAGKFVGNANDNNTPIPVTEKPTNPIIIRGSQNELYKFVLSTNGTGALNAADRANCHGVLNWSGGYKNLTDAGNIFEIKEIGDLPENTQSLIAEKVANYINVLSTSQFVVDNKSNTLVGAYTEESAAAVAEELNAFKASHSLSDFNALETALGNAEKVTLSVGEKFTIKCLDTNRGYMVYSTVENKGSESKVYLAGTNRPEYHASIDSEGIYKEWAIVIVDDKSYIYNTENQKFITSESVVKFSEEAHSSNFVDIGNLLYEIQFTANNKYLSFSPGWGADCVRTENSIDDGCKFYIEKVGSSVDESVTIIMEDKIKAQDFNTWKNDVIASLGFVGGYPVTLEAEINSLTSFSEISKFEAKHADKMIALGNGYYFIKGTGTGNIASWYAVCGTENNGFISASLSEGEKLGVKHVWSFESVEDGYKIQSPNLGKYVQLVAAPSTSTINKDFNGGSKFVFHDNGLGKFTIKDGNENIMRTEDAGQINSWGGEKTETWYIIPATELDITVGKVGYGTIHLPFDVTLPEGVDACGITTTNSTHAVLSEAKKDIPANTGAILVGAGTHTFKIAEASSDWKGNLLRGSNVNAYVEGSAYVLALVNGEAALAKAKLNKNESGADGETHFKNNANKAYLPASAVTTADARFLVFSFGDDVETAIENIEGENGNVKAEVYDLAGRRVLNAKKGVFVVNGKVIVK